jgi:hypothetical protein
MARVPVQHQPPSGVALSTLPTIKGKDEAHKWITETLGVPVRKNLVVTATNARKIPCVKIGGALHYSSQGLFDWIMSFTEAVSP